MKLGYYCASYSCGKINYLKVASNNRYDLKGEIGTEFNERCKHCGKHTKKHINRLHGEMNTTVLLIAVAIAIAGTIVLWNIGFIASPVTFGIPALAWYNERKKVSDFNKLMID
ncbi:hypothetical protein [uncultured Kordia sp.]|uniref:hypothetical protein n=1 Tax=uncultured Kordia sp. TaxID=507699 RepID=UPI002635AB2F|nr:hypothetical protein [uncultured Kordia sp.]